MLDTFWSWITESPQDRFPLPVVLGVLLGFLSGVLDRHWRRLRIVATWVHETGHALTAIVLGRDVAGISIRRDTSGVTNSIGKRSRIQQSAVAFMGYPAPAILGSALLYLVVAEQLHASIFLLIVLPALMLLLQRSILGLLITFAALALAIGLALAPSIVSALLISVLCGYLFVASPRTIFELRRHRKHRKGVEEGEHSDADTLFSLTMIPQAVWEAIFLLVSFSLPLIALVLALR